MNGSNQKEAVSKVNETAPYFFQPAVYTIPKQGDPAHQSTDG